MPIFQYRFGHGIQKLKLLIAEGVAGTPYLGDRRDRLAAAAGVLRRALARQVGHRARRRAAQPRDPQPRLLCYVLGRAAAASSPTPPPASTRSRSRTAPRSPSRWPTARRRRSGVTLGSPDGDQPPPLLVQRPGRREQHPAVHQLRRPVDVRRRHAGADRAHRGDAGRVPARCPSTTPASSIASTTRSQTGGELPVTLADARRSIELITAMYYSAETRQSVSCRSARIIRATRAGCRARRPETPFRRQSLRAAIDLLTGGPHSTEVGLTRRETAAMISEAFTPQSAAILALWPAGRLWHGRQLLHPAGRSPLRRASAGGAASTGPPPAARRSTWSTSTPAAREAAERSPGQPLHAGPPEHRHRVPVQPPRWAVQATPTPSPT